MYISDLGKYLTATPLLAFADMFFLSESATYKRKLIKALEPYLDENMLEINISKTRIIIFKKGGRGHKTKLVFKFKDVPIEFAKAYTYLGIIFTPSGTYNLTVKNSLSKGYKAIQRTINILNRLKILNNKTFIRLFNALVSSTVLYAAPISCPRHLKDLEKIQEFFKECVLNFF